MSFCPRCGAEYREGFTHCSDCACALVDRLPKQEAPALEETVYLANIPDGPVGEVQLGLLRAYDIPYQKRYQSASALARIYTGNSSMGVEIYVPQRFLKLAKELFGKEEETV